MSSSTTATAAAAAEPPIASVTATTDAASFLTNFGVESVFTKALILLFLFFFAIRVGFVVVRRIRENRADRINRHLLNHDTRHHHEPPAESNVNASTTDAVVIDFDAAISAYPSFVYGVAAGAEGEGACSSAGGGACVNDTTCPICINEYEESEVIRIMPHCGHYFHQNCIDEWLKINWSCPVCRHSPLQQDQTPSCS